jgi:hypothetical protein
MRDLPEGFSRFWTALPHSFAVFFSCWILLAIALGVFYKKASYETKRSLHPFIMIGVGILFLAFSEGISHGTVPVFFILAVVLITFLNIRLTQFCPRCGATIRPQGFSRPKFCPKCGAELER